MPVLSATQLMIHKLLSYSQHYCDFATGLPVARSLREQIDWDAGAPGDRQVAVRRGVPGPAGPAGRRAAAPAERDRSG